MTGRRRSRSGEERVQSCSKQRIGISSIPNFRGAAPKIPGKGADMGFILGLIMGGFIGISYMCLLQINRHEDDE